MKSIAHAAMLRAQTEPTPLVHQAGPEVIVLLSKPRPNVETGRLEAEGQHRRFSSVALARAVAARALTDLQVFPHQRDRICDVSQLYVEAARRNALRRAGRLYTQEVR